jgi:hypothetical protein
MEIERPTTDVIEYKGITNVDVLALQFRTINETRLRAFDATEEVSNLFWRLKSTKNVENFATIVFLTGYLSMQIRIKIH